MKTLIRVILHSNGSVQVVLANRNTVVCTPSCLMQILTDPRGFYDDGQYNCVQSTKFINTGKLPIEDVPGLDLLTVNTDNQIICDFPYIFSLLFEHLSIQTDPQLWGQAIALDSNFSDEKQFLLSLFMTLSQLRTSGITLNRKLGISENAQFRILQQIVNTHFAELKALASDPQQNQSHSDDETDSNALLQKELPDTGGTIYIPPNFITLKDYAEAHNFNYNTTYTWCRKSKLASALKDPNGQWWVNPSDMPIDHRAFRKVTEKDSSGRKYVTLQGDSYDSLLKYLLERQLFTPTICEFIRSKEEAKYYETHNYHEVEWDGFSYLIIDIVPEYYCKTQDMTNRELIEASKSPLVPNDEGHEFHLHHIGQKIESPLAIVPASDHIGLTSVFHQGRTGGENLHDAAFNARKVVFWRTYLDMYDKYGSFKKIPFLNSKHKKKPLSSLEEAF